jgi:hypothetical protein
MDQLAGWEGPECVGDGLYRYSKTISWIRLYMEVDGSEFRGGVMGAREDFEVALEGGQWKRFQTDLAYSPDGNLVLRLREYTTLDIVTRRIGDSVPIAEEMSSIEDLAAYLERCIAD